MGDWHISIRGVGAHHNKNYPADANRLARGFVESLKSAGHTIKAAHFTHGGEEDLSETLPWVEDERAKTRAEIQGWTLEKGQTTALPLTAELEKVEICARVAHETNRVYCLALGDQSQLPWEQVPAWMKESVMKGVLGILSGNTPEQSHESWFKDREARGWKYGPVKDEEKKEHPCFVPYQDLPVAQRVKDELFQQAVLNMARAIGISF